MGLKVSCVDATWRQQRFDPPPTDLPYELSPHRAILQKKLITYQVVIKVFAPNNVLKFDKHRALLEDAASRKHWRVHC